MKKFDFYLTYACNYRCIFCSVFDKIRNLGEQVGQPWSYVADVLLRKRDEGYECVVFTGGEPTVSPHFLRTLEFAKRMGYRTSINSNLSMLAKPDLCRAALPLMDELVAAVHAHTPDLHDYLLDHEGGFVRTKQAMDNIHTYANGHDLFLITDTVITRHNLPRLKEILTWISDYKRVRQCLLSVVNVPPELMHRFAELSPSLAEMADQIPGIVIHARRLGLTLRFYGAPFCVLGNHKALSADLYYEPKVVVGRFQTSKGRWENQEVPCPTPQSRQRTPLCDSCTFGDLCAGVFRTYFQQRGEEGLRPVLPDGAVEVGWSARS